MDRRCRMVPDLARRHRNLEAGSGCQYGIERCVVFISNSIGHFSMSVQCLPPYTVGLRKAHLIICPLAQTRTIAKMLPQSWQEKI